MSAQPVLDGLETEMREGVEHYKVGQHKAWRDGDQYVLRYCNVMGWCYLVLLERAGERSWQPMTLRKITATGLTWEGWRPMMRDFELSDKMLTALENAEPM